jgi:outer membrane protein assembly factor BamA
MLYVCTETMGFWALVDPNLCLYRRFFLGGVSSLRGFYEKQAGPTEACIGSSSQVSIFSTCIYCENTPFK